MIPKIKQRIEQIRRGEVPEGYKKTSVGIMPSEWKEDTLDKYLQEYKQLSNDIEKYPVYSSSRQGLIPQSQYYDNRKAVETNLGYKIVPKEYVTYRHMSDDDIFHFNINNTGREVLVSSEYPVFTSTAQGCLGYIIPMLNGTAHFRYFCRMQKMGGTRTRLYCKNLCAYKYAFPPLAEQEKIAEILSTQDKLITLKEKLIEEKKRQKKYLMQQLLTGKQRLPGFNGKWRKLLFKECIKEVDSRSSKNNQYPILSVTKDGIAYQADHFNKQIASDNNVGYKIIRRNQLAFSILNLWMGSVDVLHLCDIGIISPAYKVFECIENYLIPVFAKYFLRSYNVVWLYNINSETGASVVRKNLNLSALLNEQLTIPSIEEQEAIAQILDTADKEISMIQRDLDQEKQKKKALMQLLLTGIVRVNI